MTRFLSLQHYVDSGVDRSSQMGVDHTDTLSIIKPLGTKRSSCQSVEGIRRNEGFIPLTRAYSVRPVARAILVLADLH